MRIEELTEGTLIRFLVNVAGNHLTFDSRIMEVHPKKRLVLAEAVYRDNKVISFRGKNLIVDVLALFPDEKPQLFKNVTITVMKKADNTLLYRLNTIAESKGYNRREGFRCFVGTETSIQCGSNRAAYDAIIRDVSVSGFSFVCSNEVSLSQDQVVHALLNDYIEELAENFSFHLYGLVVRSQEVDNNRILYGCRLNSPVYGLDTYIIKKERIRLKNSGGGIRL